MSSERDAVTKAEDVSEGCQGAGGGGVETKQCKTVDEMHANAKRQMICEWFKKLSSQDRAAALAIHDGIFLSMLVHLLPNTNHQTPSQQGALTPSLLALKDNSEGKRDLCWDAGFSFFHLEKAFQLSCNMMNVSGKTVTLPEVGILVSQVPAATDEPTPNLTQEGEERKETESDPVVETRIREHNSGDDNRIHNEPTLSPPRDGNDGFSLDGPKAKILPPNNPQDITPLLENLKFIFPSLIDAVKTQNKNQDTKTVTTNNIPVLVVDPSHLSDNVVETLLADPMLNPILVCEDKDTESLLMQLLRLKFHGGNNTGKETGSLPISTLVQTRLELAILDSFRSQAVKDTKVLPETGLESPKSPVAHAPEKVLIIEEEGSSLEQYATPPEEEGSDGDEIISIFTAPNSAISNKITLEPKDVATAFEKHTDDKFESDFSRGTNIGEKRARATPNTNTETSVEPEALTNGPEEQDYGGGSLSGNIMSLCLLVSQCAIDEDFTPLKPLLEGVSENELKANLPLVPLQWFIRPLMHNYDLKSRFAAWNCALKEFLQTALARADDTKKDAKPANTVQVVEDKPKLDIQEDNLEAVVKSLDLPPVVSSSSTKRNKKKKKKRKKRSSNADSSKVKQTAQEAVVSVASAGEEKKDAPEEPPIMTAPTSVADTQTNPFKEEKAAAKIQEEPQTPKVEENVLTMTNSFDTDRTSQSATQGPPGAKTESCSRSENEVDPDSLGAKDVIRISRVEGLGTTCVVVPAMKNAGSKADGVTNASSFADKEDDEWETVEAKGRSSRSRKMSDLKGSSSTRSMTQSSGGNLRKVKSGRTAATRRRNANRKIVRDIVSSILDSVDVEVRRRSKNDVKARGDESAQPDAIVKVPPASKHTISSSSKASAQPVKPATLRDIVVGKQPSQSRLRHGASASTQSTSGASPDSKRWSSGDAKVSTTTGEGQRSGADQNTVPTLPETLSGTSGNTQSSLNTDDGVSEIRVSRMPSDDVVVGDTSSLDAEEEEPEPVQNKSVDTAENDSSTPPPLPTLLGPGNTNSASSSVASSLDAPHASSHRHHHSSCTNENDVGYHLLDVCGRLTRDMSVFMSRRAGALTSRRRERGALLGALQDTASKLWGGCGHVNMYGSCATQLDLPSSDLDVLICGLDDATVAGSEHNCMSYDADPMMMHSQQPYHNPGIPINPYSRMVQQSKNGERVLSLAAELGKMPWAFQVKAIPTARVPVVKMLADPSRLPGAASSGVDWMVQQQQFVSQAAPSGMGSQSSIDQGPYYQGHPAPHGVVQSSQTNFSPHTPLSWRGADVRNGLFSVDISFEGPEHGGIGSTQYSEEVVEHESAETGLSRETTSFVQVLMVLKELLAQRRLNEPFSGGLSSYALLLLLVAVIKERKIIKQEMDRIERHRRLVAAGGGNTAVPDYNGESGQDSSPQKTAKAPEDNAGRPDGKVRHPDARGSNIKSPRDLKEKNKAPWVDVPKEDAKRSGTVATPEPTAQRAAPSSQSRGSLPPGSSWASIARKNSIRRLSQGNATIGSGNSSSAQTMATAATPSLRNRSQAHKINSFAEAVSGKHQNTTTSKNTNRHSVKGEEGNGSRRSHVDSGKGGKGKNAQKVPTNATTASQNSQVTPPQAKKGEKEPAASPHTTKHQDVHKTGSNQTKRNIPVTTSSFVGGGASNDGKSGAQSDSCISNVSSLFPQGSNDVLEVLCSGETTPGKLLMHFLLFYGEHFESHGTAIDVSGKHHPDFDQNSGYDSLAMLSPYIHRRTCGTIDPVTGMLTVDPIVVFDPISGREGNNVARRCYLWINIRRNFAQWYSTLSNAFERSGTPSTTAAVLSQAESGKAVQNEATNGSTLMQVSRNTDTVEMASPILELVLSF